LIRTNVKTRGGEIKSNAGEGVPAEALKARTWQNLAKAGKKGYYRVMIKLHLMKSFIFTVFFLHLMHTLYAQEIFIDSLKQLVNRHNQDTTEVNALAVLCNASAQPGSDKYGKQGLELARKLSTKREKPIAMQFLHPLMPKTVLPSRLFSTQQRRWLFTKI
jgi:hypothetical protein